MEGGKCQQPTLEHLQLGNTSTASGKGSSQGSGAKLSSPALLQGGKARAMLGQVEPIHHFKWKVTSPSWAARDGPDQHASARAYAGSALGEPERQRLRPTQSCTHVGLGPQGSWAPPHSCTRIGPRLTGWKQTLQTWLLMGWPALHLACWYKQYHRTHLPSQLGPQLLACPEDRCQQEGIPSHQLF